MANNQMDSDMRRLAKAGSKAGWEWVLKNSEHFQVFDPNGLLITTVAPRNRHWRKHFEREVRPFGYPGVAQ